MRAIKFRGKCIENRKWKYGNLHVVEKGSQCHIVDFGNIYPIEEKNTTIQYGGVLNWCEVSPETIVQFTGVQDRTNSDVYEGDIIKLNGQKYVIKYFDEYALFGFSRPNDLDNPKPVGSRGSSTAYKPYVLSHFYQRRIEIIGNIHDNPELL